MDEFWKWMVEKKYADYRGTDRPYLNLGKEIGQGQIFMDTFTNNMLIGYMITYLQGKGIPFSLSPMYDAYNYLKMKIEE